MAVSLPADDKALSWSWCDTVMVSWHFFFCPGSIVWKGCLLIYFLIRSKKVHAHSVFLWLVCRWSQSQSIYWLSLPSVAAPSLPLWVFLGWGPYTVCESASAPTQKRQALLLSRPFNYFRSLPGRKGDGIDIARMKQRALWDYIQLCGECKKQLKMIPNSIPNGGFTTHRASARRTEASGHHICTKHTGSGQNNIWTLKQLHHNYAVWVSRAQRKCHLVASASL